MKKVIFVLLWIITIPVQFIAQQESTAPDGKKVLLNPDGSWKSVPAESSPAIHPTLMSHPEFPKPNPHDVIIHHVGYTLSYNPTYHIADWVAYELTAEETVPVVKRNNHFVPDPLLHSGSASNNDYKGSGYDRGHLAPSADMCYSYQTMVESFYLSNITPQTPSFNRGIWKKLEEQVRQWAVDDKAVLVVTGTILTKGLLTIGYDRITVPAYFYKVILDYTEPDIKGIGFIMPNQGSQEPLQHYAVTIDSVEKITGTDFFYQLPENQQRVIESTFDISKWSWTASKTRSAKEGNSQSVQCKGITKAGARCKNMTLNPNGYCHLHQSQAGVIQQQNNIVKPSSSRRTVPVRCSTITKKGTQCSRMTYSPNGKCWQHGGD
ncbi:MAG: DNA/RNA non-specific endonuclease [Bacteroidetes bacterium]|nr:DNA/RNA non-specific endonuclease [Bacteroidota bacterium]